MEEMRWSSSLEIIYVYLYNNINVHNVPNRCYNTRSVTVNKK